MKHSFAILFLLTACIAFSMDSPSAEGIINKNFGMNNEGLPYLGITYNADGTVMAVENGELLFRHREGDTASKLPSPLGSWLALDHGDGIISIYSRFETDSAPIPENVDKGRHLGEAGISGWSKQKGFFFQLFDRKERRWINPFMIMPPPQDIRPPVIVSVRLRDLSGNIFNPSETRTLNQGRYFLIVDSVDTMRLPNENPLAPYKITCSLNGSEAGVLLFETYSVRDGFLMVRRNGLVPVRQVFAPVPGYEVAELWLSRGQTTLEIEAQDIAGNVRNVIYRLMVE